MTAPRLCEVTLDLAVFIHLMVTLAKLMGSGGAKAVVADSLILKQQLLVINRSRQRAPNLSALDRFLLGFWSLFLSPHHLLRAAVVIKPSTLLRDSTKHSRNANTGGLSHPPEKTLRDPKGLSRNSSGPSLK